MRGELAHSRTVMKDGQLLIIRAQKRDSGLYECKASNILGHDSALTNLGVLDLPRFTINPPAQLDVGKGENISVPCQATGDPQPIITWVKDNSELPVGRSQVRANGTLQMWNVKDEDSGIYICTATSQGLFKTSSLMQLIVTVAKGKEWLNLIFCHRTVIHRFFHDVTKIQIVVSGRGFAMFGIF